MPTVYRVEFTATPAVFNDDGSVKSCGTAVENNGLLCQSQAEADSYKPNNVAVYDISDEDFAALFPTPTTPSTPPPP